MRHFLSFALVLASQVAVAVPHTGTVFEKDTGHKNALFQFKRMEEGTPASLLVKLRYLTAATNELAAAEDVVLENGKVKKYDIIIKQNGDSGSMEVRDGKIFFSYTHDGKTKTDDEKVPENFIVTATLTDFLAQHSAELLKGDTIDARLGVADRCETVGFKYFKTEEGKRDGKDTVTIKMKPVSFIIAAIVDPLYLTFTKSDFKVIEINGRTIPKRKDGDKWKDLDADTVFHYDAPKS